MIRRANILSLARSLVLAGALLCLGAGAQTDGPHETEEETIARCLRDLRSESLDVRQRAALVLGKYNHPEARRGLLGALHSIENPG